MKRALFLLSLLAAFAAWVQITPAQVTLAETSGISGERIRAHVKFLASDLLEGRGVGARGGDLASEYIATEFALDGLKPAGDNGTYFQNFTLVGADPQPTTALSVTAGGVTLPFRWLDDFVGVTFQQKPTVDVRCRRRVRGPWHRRAGIPVGRLPGRRRARQSGGVVHRASRLPTIPRFFNGEALTYYGRWTYKFEEAARHGAIGAIIIHTTPTASYGWNVVRSSWSKEELEMKLAPGTPAVGFAGWVTKEAGERIAATQNTTADAVARSWRIRGASGPSRCRCASACTPPQKSAKFGRATSSAKWRAAIRS